MNIIEINPREKGLVLRGRCQNILDDPHITYLVMLCKNINNKVIYNLQNLECSHCL